MDIAVETRLYSAQANIKSYKINNEKVPSKNRLQVLN